MADTQPSNGAHAAENTALLSGAIYDRLKFLALVVLPAVATFYLALGGLWDFNEPEKVAGTIMAFDTLLGVVLGISSNQFKAIAKAQKVIEQNTTQATISTTSVDPDTGIPRVGLTITAPLEEVLNSDVVRVKVDNQLPPEHRIPGS